ncbi:efflux RND transporter periplasmic adaptor subunit [Sphingomonas jatrophae]|uniref:HlyD family secretion protein n=1 Tax=Sphingomonas jatrophae TaxID=1166337 RepID=A0A1I6JVV7_9SPHN|nr:efflux RND transporter periplasmic adaptor subunit [Sphingomonas jatrophae]SFR83077.1 HlyD family secretion protein [Sphingomonas jatrophae]
MDQVTTPEQDVDAFLGVKRTSPRARLLKWVAVAVGVLLLLWLAWRFFFASAAPVSYVSEPVTRGDLTVTVSATGNLAPTNEVEVGSELSGLITNVFVDNNDRVAKGQELARLDTSRLQDAINQSRAQLESAQAGVMQARATADQANANLRRLMEVYRLSGGKVPSATELDTARAEAARGTAGIRTAQAAVAQARAQISSDQTQFSRASIRSPVTGVVLSRSIEPGATVAASLNAPVLFKIAEDLSAMRLEVKVDEADVGQVSKGQRATFSVDAFPGRRFPATIERVDVGANASGSSTSSSSTAAASTTGTVVAYTARLTVANPDLLLRPGMTATADIVTTEKNNVLLVPNAALRFNPNSGGGAASRGAGGALMMGPRRGARPAREVAIGRGSKQEIYVLGADGAPKPVEVTVGDSDGSQTEVSGPALRPGMRVITARRASDQSGGGARGGGGGQRRQGGNRG